MPQFSPGEQKTASVQMSNPTEHAFSYEATLYMGIDMVAMSTQQFDLAAGEQRAIDFPVTMPTQAGEYPVYLDVWSEGVLLGHFQATENVTIISSDPDLVSLEYKACYMGMIKTTAIVSIPVEGEYSVECYVPEDYCPPRYRNYDQPICIGRDIVGPGTFQIDDLVQCMYKYYQPGYTKYAFFPAGSYPVWVRIRQGYTTIVDRYAGEMVVSDVCELGFTYTNMAVDVDGYEPGSDKMRETTFTVTITNNNSVAVTRTVRLWDYATEYGIGQADPIYSVEVTLNPGQSYYLSHLRGRYHDRSYRYWYGDDGCCRSSEGSYST